MSAGGTLRLFRCRPLVSAFDELLRATTVPDLLGHPGVAYLWAGRQGPDGPDGPGLRR